MTNCCQIFYSSSSFYDDHYSKFNSHFFPEFRIDRNFIYMHFYVVFFCFNVHKTNLVTLEIGIKPLLMNIYVCVCVVTLCHHHHHHHWDYINSFYFFIYSFGACNCSLMYPNGYLYTHTQREINLCDDKKFIVRVFESLMIEHYVLW